MGLIMEVGQGQELIVGDSRKLGCLEPDTFDLIVTSPPYWNLKDYGGGADSIGSSSYDGYLDDLALVWDECYRLARPGSIMIINVNSRRQKKKFYPIAFDIVSRMTKWTLHDVNIWYIPNALPQPNHYIERLLDNKFEYLLVFVKGDADSYNFRKPRVPQKYIVADPRSNKKNVKGRCVGNVIRVPAYRPPNVKKYNYHVAAFPEELVAFFIESYTQKGDKVLDPFVGSGTTLKVARVMERHGVGVEVNSEFEELIRARVAEEWQTPDWKSVDILHSSTMSTGMTKPRKSQFANGHSQLGLILETTSR